jgi:hypothetical protein
MTVDAKLMSAMRGSGQAPLQPLCRTIRRDCALHPAFGFGLQQLVKTLQVVGATGPEGERKEKDRDYATQRLGCWSWPRVLECPSCSHPAVFAHPQVIQSR